MTGQEFIDLAGKLLASSRPLPPAVCRTAISRAYYGAFHLALAFLGDLGIATSRNHGDVWKCLGGCDDPRARRVSSSLRTLHENRVSADYRLDLPRADDPEFARSNVERAADVMSLLKQCAQEPTRSAVKAGIEAYQRRITGQP